MKETTKHAIANYITTVRISDIVEDVDELGDEIEAGTTTTEDVVELLSDFEEVMCEQTHRLHLEQFVSLRERLADIQHAIWSHWMTYMFSVCETYQDYTEESNGNFDMILIPEDKADRWRRQMEKEYDELSEKEKESDRHQADKIIQELFPFYPTTNIVTSDNPKKTLAEYVDKLSQFLIDELHFGYRLDPDNMQMLFEYTLSRLDREVISQYRDEQEEIK